MHMLVTFIGSPSSGKTTVAALMFAELKQKGLTVEFVPERARSFIAFKRVVGNLLPSEKLSLSDGDQQVIMQMQMTEEETFLKACGSSVTIISDTSPLNALLYMSEEAKQDPKIKKWVLNYLALNPTIFYLPLPYGSDSFNVLDPNRVHDGAASLAIDKKVSALLAELGIVPITLYGNASSRAEQALAVLNLK